MTHIGNIAVLTVLIALLSTFSPATLAKGKGKVGLSTIVIDRIEAIRTSEAMDDYGEAAVDIAVGTAVAVGATAGGAVLGGASADLMAGEEAAGAAGEAAESEEAVGAAGAAEEEAVGPEGEAESGGNSTSKLKRGAQVVGAAAGHSAADKAKDLLLPNPGEFAREESSGSPDQLMVTLYPFMTDPKSHHGNGNALDKKAREGVNLTPFDHGYVEIKQGSSIEFPIKKVFGKGHYTNFMTVVDIPNDIAEKIDAKCHKNKKCNRDKKNRPGGRIGVLHLREYDSASANDELGKQHIYSWADINKHHPDSITDYGYQRTYVLKSPGHENNSVYKIYYRVKKDNGSCKHLSKNEKENYKKWYPDQEPC